MSLGFTKKKRKVKCHIHKHACYKMYYSISIPDLQTAVLCRGVIPEVVLPLKFLHDVSELFECLKGLFGFLNGELGVVLLLPLRALVHRQTGARICREETSSLYIIIQCSLSLES